MMLLRVLRFAQILSPDFGVMSRMLCELVTA